jgi:hypothetical protein
VFPFVVYLSNFPGAKAMAIRKAAVLVVEDNELIRVAHFISLS